MKLNILLRTCNRAENNPDMTRIINISRDELILRCLKSLVTSINNITGDHKILFRIHDDSDQEFQQKLIEISRKTIADWEFTSDKLNNNESMKYCYEYSKDNFEEDSIIYFAEDDYLYFPNCFDEIIYNYELFKHNLGGEVAIHPADSPLEYFPDALKSPYSASRIVLGRDRHWRTCVSSPFTLMISKKAFTKHYKKFMNYSKWDGVNFHEANTINLMFIDDVHLFTPIPTLAFHLGYINPPAPFCDYKQLWEDNKCN